MTEDTGKASASPQGRDWGLTARDYAGALQRICSFPTDLALIIFFLHVYSYLPVEFVSRSQSQLFILSLRGDAIVTRDYRHDVPRASHDVFFRNLKCGDGRADAAPVFHVDGVNYYHIKVRLAAA